jgi:hypothetical protein
MAFAQAFGRQHTAVPGAMHRNRFGGVAGTGRVKTATLAEVWAKTQLVSANQQ